MGEQVKGSKGNGTERIEATKIKWIRLNPDSKLVFSTSSTSHSRKQRIIYYSQKSFTND